MKYIVFLSAIIVVTSCSTGVIQKTDASKYRIAYNVLNDSENDDYEIFTMNLDGSDKKNISKQGGVEWTYHAHGQHVYFISDKDTTHRMAFLHSMTANGDNWRKISDIRLKDSWFGSRYDGSEFIVNPHQSVDTKGFLIIDSGGKVIHEVSIELPFFSDPAFSPDGQLIAFRGALIKSKREEGFVDEIYMANSNGSNLKQLTHYPQEDTTAQWYDYNAGSPRWHPTEDFISFQSFQSGKYSLYGVSRDGNKQWKLTDLQQEEGWHDWSPDGQWLAIELFDPDQTQFHIGLMNWKTKEMNIVTDTSYQYQQAPVFVEME